MYKVFTDGACRGNGTDKARASWAFVVFNEKNDEIDRYHGLVPERYNQTNNSAEILAIVMALHYCIKKNIRLIRILSDSDYALNSIFVWDPLRKRKKKFGPLKNQDLLIHAVQLLRHFTKYEYFWVKGHAGMPGNEIADSEANKALDAIAV